MAQPPLWHLRPADLADLPALAALEAASFGPSAWTQTMLAEELAAPSRHYVVAAVTPEPEPEPLGTDKPALAAFGGIYLGEIADIMTIEVAPAWRGQGLGRAIMANLIAAARCAACAAIMLEVKTDNLPAITLYQSLGFTQVGLRRRYYQPENADAYTMRLNL